MSEDKAFGICYFGRQLLRFQETLWTENIRVLPVPCVPADRPNNGDTGEQAPEIKCRTVLTICWLSLWYQQECDSLRIHHESPRSGAVHLGVRLASA